MTDAIEIRDATRADIPLILGFVRGLARFEKEPDAVVATEADLLRDGFGETPYFEARIALLDGKPAGFALFFPNYSTWQGRPGLYVEDLFIEDWARGRGLGRAIMADLARIALARGWTRLDLAVLDWNPARGFYAELGLAHRQEWLPYRVTGKALEALANLNHQDTKTPR
jgi:GNAT superfamily N-acetyltransferase